MSFNVTVFRDEEKMAFQEWVVEQLQQDVIREIDRNETKRISYDDFLSVYTNHFVLVFPSRKAKVIGNFKPLNKISF